MTIYLLVLEGYHRITYRYTHTCIYVYVCARACVYVYMFIYAYKLSHGNAIQAHDDPVIQKTRWRSQRPRKEIDQSKHTISQSIAHTHVQIHI